MTTSRPPGPPFATVIDLLKAGAKPRRALHPIFTAATKLDGKKGISRADVERIMQRLHEAGFDGYTPPDYLIKAWTKERKFQIFLSARDQLAQCCRMYTWAYFRGLLRKRGL